MPKGISLHIGVNQYNRHSYKKAGSFLRRLPNCDRDAEAKMAIAKRFGFTPALLTNEDATADSLLNGIEMAANYLEEGDFFFLSFSGHGGRAQNRNKEADDEDDGYDETWCLHDRAVLDDELFERWKLFRPRVRILVIADSCHSGSSIKGDDDIPERPGGQFPVNKSDEVVASCLLMAACQDKQTALATGNLNHSLYTHCMLKVLEQYDFCESYRELHNRICNMMPASSTPNLFKFGPGADQFVKKHPFKI
jgi:metacaspase-1